MNTYIFLQQYWWFVVSLLGALLVFLLFVQGGNSLLYCLGKTEEQRKMIMAKLNSCRLIGPTVRSLVPNIGKVCIFGCKNTDFRRFTERRVPKSESDGNRIRFCFINCLVVYEWPYSY